MTWPRRSRESPTISDRLVPWAVREALRKPRPAARRHAVRGILTAARRAHPYRGPRNTTAAAFLRSREAGGSRRRRAARPPHSALRGGLGRSRIRAQPALSSRNDHRRSRRRQRARRARPVFVRIARARIRGRPAKSAVAAARRRLLHHQRRHADQRRPAGARRKPSGDRRARHHRGHAEPVARPIWRTRGGRDRPIPQRGAARLPRAVVSRRRRADGTPVGVRAASAQRTRREHRRPLPIACRGKPRRGARISVRAADFLGRRHASRTISRHRGRSAEPKARLSRTWGRRSIVDPTARV